MYFIHNGRQNFVGTVDNVNLAALIYDLLSIHHNGLDAKTNLSYSKFDLVAILSIEHLFSQNEVAQQ